MPKIGPSMVSKPYPGSSKGDRSLGYILAEEPPMGQAEADEMSLWLDDLSSLELVQHLDPARQRLTGHIPVRTPDKVRKNG